MNYYNGWSKAFSTSMDDMVQSSTYKVHSYMVVVRIGDPPISKTLFVRALSKLDAADGAIKALHVTLDEVQDVFVVESTPFQALR